jgi:hypothetical protein
MSRWVNGSLEDLLMVSVSPRALNCNPAALPRDATVRDGAPRRGQPQEDELRASGDAFRDDLATDALELGVRLLVVDSLLGMVADEPENVAFFTHAARVVALSEALDRVRARIQDSRVVGVLAADSPLGAYLKGLYMRAAMVARALEVFGFASMESEGDLRALAHATGEAASFHFVDLRDSIRRDLASLRIEHGQTSTVKDLRDAVEDLFKAASKMDGGRAS